MWTRRVVHTGSDEEVLCSMDEVVDEVAKGAQVTTNIKIEISVSSMRGLKSFLDHWKKVFSMVGAQFKYRKTGYFWFAKYEVTIEDSDPITARHFVAATFLAMEDGA
jgi:hypothetical protein